MEVKPGKGCYDIGIRCLIDIFQIGFYELIALANGGTFESRKNERIGLSYDDKQMDRTMCIIQSTQMSYRHVRATRATNS